MPESCTTVKVEQPSPVFADIPPSAPSYFLRDLVYVRKHWGKRAGSVFTDYIAICFRKRRIVHGSYYFKHRLFEFAQDRRDEMHRYIDDHDRRKLNTTLNELAEGLSTIDCKQFLERILKAFAIPCSHSIGMIIQTDSRLDGMLTTESQLHRLLQNETLPLFGKPVNGSMSEGAVIVDRYDPAERRLTLRNSGEISLQDFMREVSETYGESGYLLQEKITPHPQMKKISGDAIGCVRMVTLNNGDSIELLYAVWKVPAIDSVADNFWREGNICCHVCIDTGEVLRCQFGSGTSGHAISEHPDTGERILGFHLPHWDLVREHARDAAAVFHTVKVIGWDIAITPERCVIVEGNSNPDHGLFQLSANTGLLSSSPGQKLADSSELETRRIRARRSKDRSEARRQNRKLAHQALSEGFTTRT